MIVALDHTWTGGRPGISDGDAVTMREGYWVFINEPSRDRDELWIRDGQLLSGAMSTQAEPLTGVDYMVLRIRTTPTRDDWAEFCRAEVARRDEAHLVQDDLEEADRQNRLAMAAILYSDAFTSQEKRLRITELKTYRQTPTPPPDGGPGLVVVEHEDEARSEPEAAGRDLYTSRSLTDGLNDLRSSI